MSSNRETEPPVEEPLTHVGWWCWRGDNHGHLATMACRSDNVPIHVPAEWADEMRAVIQQIEDGDDEPAPAVVSSPPDTDRATVRDRVAEALYRREWPLKQVWQQALPADHSRYEALADAVLAVLPPPADRAAVLLEVADWLKAWRPEFFERWAVVEQDRYEGGVDDAAAELRRMADEARQPEVVPCMRSEAHPPHLHSGLRKGVAVHGRCPGGSDVPARQTETPAGTDAALARVERLALTFEVSGNEFIAEQIRAAVGARQPDTETQDGVARCSAAVLKRHHGPHRWAPQPGMDPVRCPGACNCPHPDGEHSVYGCADGCACEYLPPPRRAGGAGGVADETADETGEGEATS